MRSIKQRVSLLRAYGWVCPYCEKLIESLSNCEIDHIIPQSLGNDPVKLDQLLSRLGVPELQIDSYRNRVAVHGEPCNRRKGKRLLDDPALVILLDHARGKEQRVLEEEAKFERQAKSRDAIAGILGLIELGYISKEEAVSHIQNSRVKTTKSSEPIVLSFSVNVVDLLESGVLPQNSGSGPALYDFLERALSKDLENSGSFLTPIGPSERNGETISVQYASWLLDLERLPEELPFGWVLLQVNPYSEAFPGQVPDDLFSKAIFAKRDELLMDWESDDPLPYKRCPLCGSSDLSRASQVRPDETTYYVTCKCGWGERF